MRKVLDREIQTFGIGHAEMRILMIVFALGDSLSQEHITSKLEVDRSNVGRSLKKLENLGYIQRARDINDKRSFLVELTEKGKSLEKPLRAIKKRIEKTVSCNITAEESRELLKLLYKVESGMSEENYRKM